MKAVLLCGGTGTRLRPFTCNGSKQVIPIANRPVVFYALDQIERCNIKEVAVIVGDNKDEIQSCLGTGKEWNLRLHYIQQDNPRGLTHAIGLAREFVGKEKFMVILGDNFVEEDLSPIVANFKTSDRFNGFLMLVPVSNPAQYGVVEISGELVVAFFEKPSHPKGNLIATGYYLLDSHCFELFDADPLEKSARGELEISLIWNHYINNNYKVGYHILSGTWIDTGTTEDVLAANQAVLENLSPRNEGSFDAASLISGAVSIGLGTEIVNSRVSGPVIIGRDCNIRDSYIGPFTSVHDGAILANCEIANSVLLQHVNIENVGARIESSMIGRGARINQRISRPRTLQLRLGDYSVIDLP